MSSDPKTYIEFITGPMFSGKTTRLLKIAAELKKEGKSVLLLKPKIDNRYSKDKIVSHNGNKLEAVNIQSSREIPKLVNNKTSVLIDEVQLFDSELYSNLQKIQGKADRIYCSGLDLDYTKNVFGISEQLMNVANVVTRLTSTCELCGESAEFTYKKIESEKFVGGKEMYEPRCSNCY